MSFTTIADRVEAIEREMGELKQNATIISLAIIKLTHVVDAAVKQMECPVIETSRGPVSAPVLNQEFPEIPEGTV